MNKEQFIAAASSRCGKQYAKGAVSFDLLAQVDPDRVAFACAHAKALVFRLQTIMPAVRRSC